MSIITKKIRDDFSKLCFSGKSSKEIVSERLSRLWFMEGITVALDEGDIRIFNEIIDRILGNNAILENFTRKEIENQVQEIISNVGKTDGDKKAILDAELKDFESRLKGRLHDWIFIIPIENLELPEKRRSFKVGKVIFYRFSKNREQEWISNTKELIKQREIKNRLQDKSGKKYLELLKKEYLSKLIGKTVAEIEINGTVDNAQELALKKVRLALAVIRLFSYVNDDFYRRYFGIKGEIIPPDLRAILAYRKDGSGHRPSTERIGFLYPFELDDKRLKFMKKNGFKKIDEILKKENNSDLEKRIISAIYWYGEAMNVQVEKTEDERIIEKRKSRKKKGQIDASDYVNLSDRFLKLVISLEAIFLNLVERESNKSENLSERVALLIRDRLNDRFKIKQFIKSMYRLRSDIVHEGMAMISGQEVKQLMMITQETILTLLLRKDRLGIHSDADLYYWFERKKLT